MTVTKPVGHLTGNGTSQTTQALASDLPAGHTTCPPISILPQKNSSSTLHLVLLPPMSSTSHRTIGSVLGAELLPKRELSSTLSAVWLSTPRSARAYRKWSKTTYSNMIVLSLPRKRAQFRCRLYHRSPTYFHLPLSPAILTHHAYLLPTHACLRTRDLKAS